MDARQVGQEKGSQQIVLRPIKRVARTPSREMEKNLLGVNAAPLGKARQIQEAKRWQQQVLDRAARRGAEAPNYEFLELTGKGSYGRVFKCKNRETQQICAVKIIEADAQDFRQDAPNRDNTINEFLREIQILQVLKESNATNVNFIHDAHAFETQLWIVSDFCDGGSLNTLMKARHGVLEERFIIPIAREAAVALRDIHAAGIIHRDVKCANILVGEDGQIQLCDFGVSAAIGAGTYGNGQGKRTTIIGTPHWMAPELVVHLGLLSNTAYSTEVDIWAFGIALIEMATGRPPNAGVVAQRLGPAVESDPPRLEGNFSQELKDFVAYCLKMRPEDRPTAADLLEHPYIKNSAMTHPTSSIAKLVEDYWNWQQLGGQRMSLFSPMGAIGSDPVPSDDESDEDWNFSTTEEFNRRASMLLLPNFRESMELSNYDKLMKELEEQRGIRGQQALARIFDTSSKGYDPNARRTSDLPFRNLADAPAADRTTMIDLDAAIPLVEPNLNLADPPSLRSRRFHDFDDEDDTLHPNRDSRVDRDWDSYGNRRTQDWKFPNMQYPSNTAKRVTRDSGTSLNVSQTVRARPKTQDWKFPTAEEMAAASEPTSPVEPTAAGGLRRPALKHAQTMPITASEPTSSPPSPDRSSMIDLDTALVLEVPSTRPSTAGSTTDSAISETTTGDPFDLEDQIDGGVAARPRSSGASTDRGSFHRQSQSEPTLTTWNRQIFGGGASAGAAAAGPATTATVRGQAAAAAPPKDTGRRMAVRSGVPGLPQPNVEVLLPGAKKAVVKAEMGRMGEDVIVRCRLGKQRWVAFATLV